MAQSVLQRLVGMRKHTFKFLFLVSVCRNLMGSIFWDIPLEVNRRFGGPCYLDLQGLKMRQTRNQREARGKLCVHEVEGVMFHGNAGLLSINYTLLYPRR